jgi:nucleotide-binding universal stress UspA family protein
MYTKILVAVSTSQDDTLLASAIETARKYDARLYALHVVDPTPCLLGPADSDYGLILEAMQAHGRDVVARVSQTLQEHPLQAEAHMLTRPFAGSTVGHQIAAFGEEQGVDLILLGKRKAGWWRWLSEDVASSVQRHAETPVQIVSATRARDTLYQVGSRWSTAPAVRAR